MNPTRTESIRSFLLAKTHTDLALLYNYNMECQVNVAKDEGTRIEKEYLGTQWQGWTNGIQTWKSFRIPINASTTPEYKDVPMSFSLEDHAEGIGMTGWDWKDQKSRWVAYDFDAMLGHSDKHQKKLSDEELQKIIEILQSVEWVTIRKSTGGKGLHVYVFLDPTTTKNHTEHAALARAILGKLAAITGYDFSVKVDACGQNMWIWHRKMTVENQGLKVIKQGSILMDVPKYWESHIQVISGQRKKNLPKFIESGQSDSMPEQKFDDLSSKTPRITLDEDHKKLILFLEDRASGSWWDIDHHMLVTHTWWLKKAHNDLEMRGDFETSSKGEDAPNDINCFAFPMRRGGWSVRRYTMGIAEAPIWEQDGKGWTRCFYNVDLDLNQASKLHGGLEDTTGAYVFTEALVAIDALKKLGASIPNLPSSILNKRTRLKLHKDNRVLMEIDGESATVSNKEMEGFLPHKKKWIKFFNIAQAAPVSELDGTDYDDLIRHLITPNGNDSGWVIKGETNKWRREPVTHVTMAMQALGIRRNEIQSALGASVLRAWTIVNRPFQAEYPGDRAWNESSAQLKYAPSQGDTLSYPHWNKILDHVGGSLNSYIQDNPWAQANNVQTGADYLKLWIASIFKEPLEPLPYLFCHGPQNSGKSILHEALHLLLSRGYARADLALVNSNGFNDELAGAVLAIIEEIDLRKDKNAANRIKDWVTAKEILLHPKGKTPYHAANSLHFIQCSNSQNYCPIFPGDTRITMIYVPELSLTSMIPKKDLLPLLEKEAPDFLAAVLKMEIPPSNDRLNVPVITTSDKLELQLSNSSPVEIFFAEKYHKSNGEMILYGELYEAFKVYVGPLEEPNWSKKKFGQEIPSHFPRGRRQGDSQICVGNISNTPPDSRFYKDPLITRVTDNGYTFLVSAGDKQFGIKESLSVRAGTNGKVVSEEFTI